MFYDDPRVLYVSVHRYDDQNFWPKLRESNFDFTGSGRGRGYNVNIPLNTDDVGDAEYLAIFHQLILPIAYEGGYYHDSLAESVAHTVSALLGDPMPSLDPLTEINTSVLKSIADCISVLRYRWRSLHLFQLAELVPAPDLSHIPERS
ncbi:Histone deacetylase 6 [Fasciolopsis buskii]|uniref:Histone deacetylase 6 n=1 Tax=Fasciolopsis buskii TaxID=27845 RepID=A0A8E0RIY7_9TREM|nr:Histone deacetylase 6 [Fasciolopsis buski]